MHERCRTARCRAPRCSPTRSRSRRTSQRAPERNPRSISSCRVPMYSGMKRCAAEREAEIDHAAEQQHPGPHIDVDAELERAHPAREQHLRQIDQRGARRGSGMRCRRRAARANYPNDRSSQARTESIARVNDRRPRSLLSVNATPTLRIPRPQGLPSKRCLTFGSDAGQIGGFRLADEIRVKSMVLIRCGKSPPAPRGSRRRLDQVPSSARHEAEGSGAPRNAGTLRSVPGAAADPRHAADSSRICGNSSAEARRPPCDREGAPPGAPPRLSANAFAFASTPGRAWVSRRPNGRRAVSELLAQGP